MTPYADFVLRRQRRSKRMDRIGAGMGGTSHWPHHNPAPTSRPSKLSSPFGLNNDILYLLRRTLQIHSSVSSSKIDGIESAQFLQWTTKLILLARKEPRRGEKTGWWWHDFASCRASEGGKTNKRYDLMSTWLQGVGGVYDLNATIMPKNGNRTPFLVAIGVESESI